MKISVIIAAFNASKTLNKLMKSIINQKYKDYEVIFINDGSTDDTLSILESFEKKYQNIIVKTIKNSGPGIARKIGYKVASGDLLFFIDSDDYLPNDDVFSKINNLFENSNFDLLVFNTSLIFNDKIIISNGFINPISKKIKSGLLDINIIKNNTLEGALWHKILRRDLLKEEFFVDSNCYEDFYTTYLYLNECKNFYYTDDILYCSDRTNENSLSKKLNVDKIYKGIKLFKDLYEKTSYKDSVSLVITDFYLIFRRKIEKSKFNLKQKKEYSIEIKKILKIVKIKSLIRLRISFEYYLKFIYYYIYDFIYKLIV